MPNDPILELSELARRVEEQLRFYREIGISDIGGSAVPDGALAAADSGAETDLSQPLFQIDHPASPSSERGVQPAGAETLQQVSLFGEETAAPRRSAASKPAGAAFARPDPSLEAIREDLGACVRCKLHSTRTNIVFGEGNPRARIVFVGEGPGADEDATGRPFVGRAGQLLNKIIEAIGLKREDVYICNVVKCRPPGNRTPERDETSTCEPFLFRQLAVIQPEVIVALGLPAFQCLLKSKESMSRARGEWRDWNGIKVMPTFHPAYLLRSPEKKRETWEDMKKVRDYLASQAS